jgi:hypothetical protein
MEEKTFFDKLGENDCPAPGKGGCWEKRVASKTSKGAREDALALNGEEGRGKLRKAAGTGKHGSIRRCPNGATRVVEDYSHL